MTCCLKRGADECPYRHSVDVSLIIILSALGIFLAASSVLLFYITVAECVKLRGVIHLSAIRYPLTFYWRTLFQTLTEKFKCHFVHYLLLLWGVCVLGRYFYLYLFYDNANIISVIFIIISNIKLK